MNIINESAQLRDMNSNDIIYVSSGVILDSVPSSTFLLPACSQRYARVVLVLVRDDDRPPSYSYGTVLDHHIDRVKIKHITAAIGTMDRSNRSSDAWLCAIRNILWPANLEGLHQLPTRVSVP